MIYKDLIEDINKNCKFELITMSDISVRYPHYKIVHINRDAINRNDYSSIPKRIVDSLINEFRNKCDDFQEDWNFLGIQKYDIGDYISPHEDIYGWHKLLILTSSDIDGLAIQNEEKRKVEFHNDVEGNCFGIPYYSKHWVNPVRDKTRYTCVLMR